MIVTLGQRLLLKRFVIGSVAFLLLAVALIQGSTEAQAGPPYDILFSTDKNHVSNLQSLDGATVTDDIWVFIDDSGLQSSEVWWRQGKWFSRVDDTRNSSYKSFDWEDNASEPMSFSKMGQAGEHTITAIPVGSGEPQMESTYTIPYGAKYVGHSSAYKGVSVQNAWNDRYIVAGNQGSGSSMDWKIEKISASTGLVSDSVTIDINGGQDELYALSNFGSDNRAVAVGSYQVGPDMRPVAKAIRRGSLASDWTQKDIWGAAVNGAILAAVVGLADPHATSKSDSAWLVGYEHDGNDPYWAMSKLNVSNGAIFGTGVWNQSTKDMANNPIKGEAMSLTKDTNYIYVGGYIEDTGGSKHWRLEKRDRDDGSLVQEMNFDGTTLPVVEGQILSLGVQVEQGTEAIWAGGWEDRGAGPEWRFQKFTIDGTGNLVPDVSKTWNQGSIKSLDLRGNNHVYFGGSHDAANPRWRIEAYGRDGVKKAAPEDVLLDEDLSGSADVLSSMSLPYVVGWNGSTGQGFVWGVKFREDSISCSDIYGPASTQAERFVIDHTNRGGLMASNGLDTNTVLGLARGMENPIVQSPIIPAGKYDIGQVTSDMGHAYHTEDNEQTQDHENLVTYFFSTSTADFAKTGQSDDIPNDWTWNDTKEIGLTIPFDVSSTTIAAYIYDQDDGGSTAINWNNKGVLSYSATPLWRHGGSMNAVCTVLDRYAACNDGIDNDGDGLTDFGDDLGCVALDDDDEGGALVGACTLTGDYVIVNPWEGVRSDKTIVEAQTTPVTASIPPGTYRVTLQSFDAHKPTHGTQADEVWKAELLDAGGTVLVTSGVSDDIPDLDTEIKSVVDNYLTVPAGVTELRAKHGAYFNNTTANSLKPICASFDRVDLPNLDTPSTGPITTSAGFDRATGFYDSVSINYSVTNTGASSSGPFSNGFVSDFGIGAPSPSLGNVTSRSVPAGLVAGASTPTDNVELTTNVPPGDYLVTVTADSDDIVIESDETDNDKSVSSSYIPAPDPGVELNAAPPGVVSYGKAARLEWDIHATYPMECSIYGSGGVIHTFDPSVDGATGQLTSVPVRSKIEFILKCIEKISTHDDVFSDSAIVETTGKVEEV